MTVLAVRTVPDPVLREKCTPVAEFDAVLAKLVSDMLETLYAAKGRGLAAPQVGITQRVFVMDPTWKQGAPLPMIFVNPEVLQASERTVTQPEGCLSIPGDVTEVCRPDQVRLRWQDVDGMWHEADFTGFEAACTQHELDHLDGILITDKAA